ncbi:MAG TPA: YfiR family protein [Rariglobus sp.]
MDLTPQGTRVRKSGRLFTVLLWLGLSALTGPAAVGADHAVSKEYQLKAAFLYNFSKFVQWPPERFSDEKSPIVIAVLGDNPFGDELENAVRGRLVNGRPIIIKIIDRLDQVGSAQVLFIDAKEERHLGDSLPELHRAGVLTVGETRQFAEMGGIITFTLAEDKVRFEINQLAGEKAGLKINAQLLKLAAPARKSS